MKDAAEAMMVRRGWAVTRRPNIRKADAGSAAKNGGGHAELPNKRPKRAALRPKTLGNPSFHVLTSEEHLIQYLDR